MQKHEKIKQEMERLFFNETILEQEIDDFISENDVILEQCLGLINPLRQVKLENIHGDNPKDFKPDLIAYDQDNKVWKVVDYKRAKRNIIRNNGKARAYFKAEVTELEAQLDDYLEYFKDKKQQKHFQEKYNYLIEYPGAIGLIGNISNQEEKEFSRIKRRLPRWLDIIPYNYLYERYCRYLETVRQVMNS
ncbi:NADH dehydrogenase subunit 2 [Bacillus cereus Rock3-42]|nr:NADH dehydrogenase subunit 2 [Bacillus cereus Rock3-42]